MASKPLTLAAMKLLRENNCSQPQNPKQKLQALIRTELTLSNELWDRVESNTHSIASILSQWTEPHEGTGLTKNWWVMIKERIYQSGTSQILYSRSHKSSATLARLSKVDWNLEMPYEFG